MKRTMIFLAVLPLCFAACNKDSVETPTQITIEAKGPDGFAWVSDAQAALFCQQAGAVNVPLTVVSTGTASATLAGSFNWATGPHTIYSYYPLLSLNNTALAATFKLETQQDNKDNAAKNTFLAAKPYAAESAPSNGNVSLTYEQMNASLELRLSVPGTFSATTIKTVTLYSKGFDFYTQMDANLIEQEVSYPVKGVMSSTDALTLVNSTVGTVEPGGLFTGILYVIPDEYGGETFEIEIATADGNYATEYTFTSDVAPGQKHIITYTLSNDDWYDPVLPRTTAEGLETNNPLNAPVKVDLSYIIADGKTPASIELTPTDAGSDVPKVVYTVTARDIANTYAIISGGSLDNRPMPSVTYRVEVLNSAGITVGATNVTTSDAPSDIQIIQAGSDLKEEIENASRKTRLFLMPGEHNITAAVNITTPLEIVGDSPDNTFINSSHNLAPVGTISNLNFSGFTWKASAGFFMRPIANATNGAFTFGQVKMENCIFDFSEASGSSAVLYYPSASAEGYPGRVENLLINDIIMFGNGDNDKNGNQAIITLWGGDVHAQFGTISVTNSTFSDLWWGLITLPAGANDILQEVRNGGKAAKLVISQNTFYNLCCNPGFASSSAAIHTGSSSISMDCDLTMENNIIHFGGPSTFYGILNCTQVTAEFGKFSNNWGLQGQHFKLRGGAVTLESGLTGYGLYNPFPGGINDLFDNPMGKPTTPGASFKVTGSGVNNAGDPRWN